MSWETVTVTACIIEQTYASNYPPIGRDVGVACLRVIKLVGINKYYHPYLQLTGAG